METDIQTTLTLYSAATSVALVYICSSWVKREEGTLSSILAAMIIVGACVGLLTVSATVAGFVEYMRTW